MKKWQRLNESKEAIVEDMMSCIRYLPNRELDILAFMELYQKANGEHRPFILGNLRDCMDGKEYPNPYDGSYRYSEKEVEAFGEILDKYAEKLSAVGEKPILIANCVQEVVGQIKELNERCAQVLIDDWRRERICDVINEAAKQAGLDVQMNVTLQHRMW